MAFPCNSPPEKSLAQPQEQIKHFKKSAKKNKKA